jgi:hypothetical protein
MDGMARRAGILDQLIARLPEDAFEQACDTAWATAAGVGRSREVHLDDEPQQQLFDVADHLLTWIWELPEPELTRVSLLAELYGWMPSTPVLFGIAVHLYQHISAAGRAELWRQLRLNLNSEDERRADPVSCYLRQEWLEDPDRRIVEEVWSCLVDGQPADRALRRVLEVSGPVPVDLKAELASRLIDDPEWHRSIFLALVDSRLGSHGKWDADWAEGVYPNLRDPPPEGRSVEAAIEHYARDSMHEP